MPIQTPEQYFSNEDNFGSYQYISLKDIIDDLLIDTTDHDNYLNNTPRRILLRHTRRGIQRLNREIKKTVLAVEYTVPDSLFFPLPQDYIDWVRVSVVMPDFKLKPLNINYSIATSIGYLQNDNADVLFDNNGYVLQSDGSNAYAQPYKKYSFGTFGEGERYSKFGEFTIDERRKTILFSSELQDREVVIEYISDGLQSEILNEDEVTIHKDLVETLQSYVYMETISGRRSVPANEKQRAKDSYKALLHKLKIDALNLDYNGLIQMVSI
jgi:hypothetical protein